MAFVKMLHCAQINHRTARLVQLIIHTVPKMWDFLIVFALLSVGFALAFLLVFKTRITEHDMIHLDEQLQFNDLPVSLFQARLEARVSHQVLPPLDHRDHSDNARPRLQNQPQ